MTQRDSCPPVLPSAEAPSMTFGPQAFKAKGPISVSCFARRTGFREMSGKSTEFGVCQIWIHSWFYYKTAR